MTSSNRPLPITIIDPFVFFYDPFHLQFIQKPIFNTINVNQCLCVSVGECKDSKIKQIENQRQISLQTTKTTDCIPTDKPAYRRRLDLISVRKQQLFDKYNVPPLLLCFPTQNLIDQYNQVHVRSRIQSTKFLNDRNPLFVPFPRCYAYKVQGYGHKYKLPGYTEHVIKSLIWNPITS